MKKIFTITTIATVFALIAVSVACKKTSTSTNNSTTTTTGGSTGATAAMAASYTAGAYSSGTGTTTSAFTQSLTAVQQGGGSQYGIQGSVMSGGTPLTIYMVANITGTGTIALGASGNYGQFIVGPPSSTTSVTYATGYPTANPGSGILNITSFSTSTRLISGTFSYTAGTPSQGAPTTIVNNGTFSNVGF